MFTDTVGSTARAQSDEPGALRALEEQERIVRPIFAEFRGREIKSTGDGFLVEFESALKAVQCAVEIQRRMHEHGLQPGTSPGRLRIGIHLGDVEVRGEDIFGDAVNIAARMEPIAEPGGVAVSAQVYDQIRNKLPFQFESQGPKSLKGIAEPVQVYRIRLPWLAREPSTVPADSSRIAILPFANMSPDPADQYFADGLTEELIATVSKVRELSVISRTSVMPYKSQSKHAGEIGADLGVATLLEGSVRKAGNRVRITVQLIDARNDKHLWAETYDKELDDIFAVQSSIAEKVAGELGLRLVPSERKNLDKKPTENTEAYSLFLRGVQLFQDRSEAPVRQALGCFEKSVELDPRFARGWVAIARCHQALAGAGLEQWDESIAACRGLLERAAALDPDLPELHEALAQLYYHADDGPAAEAEARRTLELNPSRAGPYFALAEIAALRGQLDEVVRYRETSVRLDPLDPVAASQLAAAYIATGRESDALGVWRRMEVPFPRQAAQGWVEYYLSKGDVPKVREYLSLREKLGPPERLWKLWIQGCLAAMTGEREAALAAVAAIQSGGFGAAALNLVACIHYFLGDLDSYFAYLDQALAAHAIQPFAVMYHPMVAGSRKDPRFPRLVERLREQVGIRAA